MPDPLTHQIVHAMVLEALAQLPGGQFEELYRRVKELAEQRGLWPAQHGYENVARERVRESMWQCLIQGLLLFGMDASNQTWPFYKLTEHGRKVIEQGAPQPYDPDGFLTHFKRVLPQADATVYSYLEEAVATFNHACPRAAAVMLGCASEKLILLLIEAFDSAIDDAGKRAKYQKDIAANWTIASRYRVLSDRLEAVVAAKKVNVPKEVAETIAAELPAGYELLRRTRNAVGHPEIPVGVDSDAVFLNLRMFIEYTRRLYELIGFLRTTKVDW